jgi:Nuclease-related domain
MFGVFRALTSRMACHAGVNHSAEAGMFWEMGLIAAGVYAYRRLRANGALATLQRRSSALTRADVAGEIGEQRTQAKLRETLTWLCGSNYYLHDGPLIIEHAPGTPFPTIEIDHLAITPFGVFVIETKNWSGYISRSVNEDKLIRMGNDGRAEERKSPLAQNQTKLAFVRSRLANLWPIAGAGVFSSNEVTLAPDLPIDLLRLEDLPQWLRTHRDMYADRRPVPVAMAWKAIRMHVDTSPSALANHKSRVRGKNP